MYQSFSASNRSCIEELFARFRQYGVVSMPDGATKQCSYPSGIKYEHNNFQGMVIDA